MMRIRTTATILLTSTLSRLPITLSSRPLSTIGDKPVHSVVPPGSCQFTPDLQSVPLLSKTQISKDTFLLTFATPDTTKPLNLPTCGCILAEGGTDVDGSPVVRPYTPISPNTQLGSFTLMVRSYPKGILSSHMSKMSIGETLSFKHIPFNVKLQYPFYPQGCANLVMIAGGTGAAPMIQALHSLLGEGGEHGIKRINMIYGSKDEEGILAKDTLESWSANSSEKFTITHVLSREPPGTGYKGIRGVIGKDVIEKVMEGMGEDVRIWVCGPDGMYDSICGPRGDENVGGVLGSMGFSKEQVYKF